MNRSDDSGTTANFTDWMEQTAPNAWTHPADDTWPVKGGEAANGTSGVIDAVKNGDGTIGYADESQAGDLGVAKIKVGQKAFVRSNAFPGKEFEGRVTEIAPMLATPRISARGARRATDVEVMEVMIDLEGGAPLLPGMRAEAFFR